MDTPLLPDPPTEDFWASSDPLGEVLHLLRMGGTFYALSEVPAKCWWQCSTCGEGVLRPLWTSTWRLRVRCPGPGTGQMVKGEESPAVCISFACGLMD